MRRPPAEPCLLGVTAETTWPTSAPSPPARSSLPALQNPATSHSQGLRAGISGWVSGPREEGPHFWGSAISLVWRGSHHL